MVVVIRPFIFGEHMTVPASDRLSQLYTGNGVNTRFDFTFRVFDQEDATGIAVKVDLGTEFETMDESLYQVTINQDNLGGYVVFNTAPSNQTSFYIAGETPVDQALDITNYDNFYPDSIEKSLDKLTAILQEWSHLLGFEEQARKLSNIKYDESAQLRENQIKAELQDSINFIEQNTSAKLQEAIANGTVSALAITTVESESDLANLLTWDGRTVSVTSIGNYKYNSSAGQWQRDFITDRQVVTVNSIAELLTLPKWDGRVVNVISYWQPNYTSPVLPVIEGGDLFRYVYSLRNINDGGVCINGWMRQKATYNYLTPEMFGAKGISSNYDDQEHIQNMLNAGAEGCTFSFDGAKTYYNGFKIDDVSVYIDHYNAASNSRQWIRKLGATFNFNGCKFLRRTPTGDIEDVPFKTKYSDNDSSLLLIKGAENVYFNNGNFDSNATLGTFVDINNDEIEKTKNLYYTAKVGTHGIRLNNCNKVFFSNTIVEKAYFNIFIDGSTNVFGNVITNYSVQCPIRSYAPNDMNLGAGLKVWFSRNVKMNVTGKYNANATAEIEKFNYDVEINGGSEYDYSNGMVIQSTKGMRFDWTSKKVIGGTTLLIMDAGTGAADDYCSDIRGRVTSYDVAYCGLYIIMSENCTQDFYGIEIDLQSEISAYAGLNIVNKSANKVIKGCKIHHWSHNDNGTMKSRVFEGAMTGDVKGGSSNTDYGLFVRGTNTKETCMRFELDLRECTIPWVIAPTAIAEFNNTITPTNAFFIAANLTQNFGSADLGMSYNKRGAVYFNQDVMHSKAAYTVLDNLNNAHGSEKFRLFYDPASGASTTGGTTFPVKVFIPT